jgi:hypothetical protein
MSFGRNTWERKHTFQHEPIQPLPKLERLDTDHGRFYLTPDGMKLPSVTTVLGSLDNSGIESWKEWQDATFGVGSAEKIKKTAARRGSALHEMCERYLLNEPGDITKGQMPLNVQMFKSLIPILDENIETVYATETQVYSKELMAAGTFDLLAQFRGKRTVADFKSASKPKTEEMIQSYFIQTNAYGIMLDELINFGVEQTAIIIAVEHEEPQLFIKDINEYKELTLSTFRNFSAK